MATTKKPRSTEPDPNDPLFDENGWPVRFATMKEVARLLGKGERAIERAKDLYNSDPDGKDDKLRLRFIRVGRSRRMTMHDLAELLELDREDAA